MSELMDKAITENTPLIEGNDSDLSYTEEEQERPRPLMSAEAVTRTVGDQHDGGNMEENKEQSPKKKRSSPAQEETAEGGGKLIIFKRDEGPLKKKTRETKETKVAKEREELQLAFKRWAETAEGNVTEEIQKKFLRESMRVRKRMNSYNREIKMLYTFFERTVIQHKLARDHYGNRAFYWNFIPLTALSSLTAILGFLITGEGTSFVLGGSAGTEIISIAIGIIGAVSAVITTISNKLKYDSKSEIQEGAVKSLEKIRLEIKIAAQYLDRAEIIDDEIMTNIMNGETNKTLTEFEELGVKLAAHHSKIAATQDTCANSPIPDEVARAFNSMKEFSNDDEFGHDEESGFEEQHISLVIFLYNRLWKEFMDNKVWPMWVPNIDVFGKARKWKKEFVNKESG